MKLVCRSLLLEYEWEPVAVISCQCHLHECRTSVRKPSILPLVGLYIFIYRLKKKKKKMLLDQSLYKSDF